MAPNRMLFKQSTYFQLIFDSQHKILPWLKYLQCLWNYTSEPQSLRPCLGPQIFAKTYPDLLWFRCGFPWKKWELVINSFDPSAIDGDSVELLSVLHSKLKFEWQPIKNSKKNSNNQKFFTSFYATCGRYNLFKKNFKIF